MNAPPYNPPHAWVAERIDMSVPGVSLLRNGKRLPSISLMRTIESEFGWSFTSQAYALDDDYAAALNQILAQYYAEQEEINE